MKTIKIVVAVFLVLVLCSAAVPEKDDYQTRAEIFLAGIIEKEVDKSAMRPFPSSTKEPQKHSFLAAISNAQNLLLQNHS